MAEFLNFSQLKLADAQDSFCRRRIKGADWKLRSQIRPRAPLRSLRVRAPSCIPAAHRRVSVPARRRQGTAESAGQVDASSRSAGGAMGSGGGLFPPVVFI